uniref:Uncharacterized protein n=1 Tax=Oryza sativa subsp. japonica TaxID=39947 RepID=Q69Y74_ORYSJ|nr:hypothetical protein [Oryza sativa Japonica Group]BAD37644.1 hypothetical protein [Oryza sativa Japonica Group]
MARRAVEEAVGEGLRQIRSLAGLAAATTSYEYEYRWRRNPRRWAMCTKYAHVDKDGQVTHLRRV